MRIGVLALQGAFREHIMAFEALGVEAFPVRRSALLAEADGLVIPGGESTAIAKLMEAYDFYSPVVRRFDEGMAVWGTCAGAILVAREIIDALPDARRGSRRPAAVSRCSHGTRVVSWPLAKDSSWPPRSTLSSRATSGSTSTSSRT